MGMWDQAYTAWTQQTTGGGLFDALASTFDVSKLAPDLLSRVQEHQKQLISLDMFRRTTAAARKLLYHDGTDCIRLLTDLGEFQNSNSLLQPYLVAMPEYRKPYNEFMAAGFENGFSKQDGFRGTGYMHTDANYRDITSGISTSYDEDKIWQWVTSDERTHKPDRIEKQMVQMMWGYMRDMDWEDGEPCSELNASF